MKILFVDDERAILEQAKIFLKKEAENLDIETTISADNALELLDEYDYDAIISDYQMPGMDGLEFLEAVREDRDSNIPFIMFTGKGREEVAMEALNLGADRYLQKGGDPKSQYGVLADAIIQEVEYRKVKERKDLFRISTSRAPEAISIIDQNANILYVNEQSSRNLGYSIEELEKMKIWEIDMKLSPDKWKKHWQKCQKNQKLRTESENVRKDGTKFPVEVLINHIEYNGKEYHFSFARDITERKEIENELKKSREEYKELINEMNDTAWVIDSDDGSILEVNDAATEVLGYSKEELLSMNIRDIEVEWGPEDITNLIESIEGNEVQIIESVHETKDEKKVPVEISSTLINYKGETQILNIARDISRRKEAEKREKFRNIALGFLNVYSHLYGEEETEKLMKEIESEFETFGIND